MFKLKSKDTALANLRTRLKTTAFQSRTVHSHAVTNYTSHKTTTPKHKVPLAQFTYNFGL